MINHKVYSSSYVGAECEGEGISLITTLETKVEVEEEDQEVLGEQPTTEKEPIY